MGRSDPIPAGARRLGHDLRALRLARNITQAALATRAGVSVHSLKNLERGVATVRTLVLVLGALQRDDWLALAGVALPASLAAGAQRTVTSRQRAAGAHAAP